MSEGWQGWDEYARFYDWENAQTLGRRDIPFWRRLAADARGRVLELGCGTGRVTIPLARAGVDIVGVDRSASMLRRARRKARRSIPFARADIRALPFRPQSFAMVIAPYGMLQSLTRPRDLTRTLSSVAAVVKPRGTFAVDLVPDVPRWREYSDRVTFRGRSRGADVTLIESVRQDRASGLTTFDERYVERRSGRTAEKRFSLVFRTLTVDETARRLARAGFTVEAVLGDYGGRPWDDRADVWIVLARRRAVPV
ncbi:MAG TPA: class I SAM-dependent methyltransferase [Vicinamibacterales bacterium]